MSLKERLLKEVWIGYKRQMLQGFWRDIKDKEGRCEFGSVKISFDLNCPIGSGKLYFDESSV